MFKQLLIFSTFLMMPLFCMESFGQKIDGPVLKKQKIYEYTFLDLPDEIIFEIINFLILDNAPRSIGYRLCQFSLVCKKFRNLISNAPKKLKEFVFYETQDLLWWQVKDIYMKLGFKPFINKQENIPSNLLLAFIEAQKTLLNAKDGNGYSALSFSILKNDMRVFELCLNTPFIDVNTVSKMGNTPLILAASSDNTPMVLKLLEHNNVSIDVKNKDGNSAFFWPVSYFHNAALTKKMLRMSPSLYFLKDHVDAIAHYARKNNDVEALKLLSDAHQSEHYFEYQFLQAVWNGQIAIIEDLIKNRPNLNVNCKNYQGNTALIIAIENDDIQMLEFLLKNPKININMKADNGNTALICATMKNHTKFAGILLDVNGIDVNSRNKYSKNALMHAIRNGNLIIFSELLANCGIDVNARDNDGNTALILSILYKNKHMIEILLNMPEIDAKITNNNHFTALDLAKYHYPEVVDLIKDHIAKKNKIDWKN